MGLDSHLYAIKHISGYEFSTDTEKSLYKSVKDTIGLKEDELQKHIPSGEIKLTILYWRKANQIHSWFVQNCQNGVDDCNTYHVERKQLEKLRDLCKEVVATKDTSLLETKNGFFFGSTDYDEWYYKDLEKTAKELDSILNNPKWSDWYFEYRASW